jgi:hypothetical protein
MTLSDGFDTSRDSCGPDCCMQVVRPGTIKCDLCDNNPNVRRLEARVERMISNARKYDDELFEAQSIKARRSFDLGMSFGIEFFTGDDDEEPNPNWAQLENHDIPPLGTINWKVTGRGQSTEEAIVHALLLALAEKVARVDRLETVLKQALIPLAVFKLSDAYNPVTQVGSDLRAGLLFSHDMIFEILQQKTALVASGDSLEHS